MTQPPESITRMLKSQGQEHLLDFYASLDEQQQESLVQQLEMINFQQMQKLIGQEHHEDSTSTDSIQPPVIYPTLPEDHQRYRDIGVEMIRAGKVAPFTVAGGQGTRLGWNGPKGAFPATVLTGKPLFRVFAEQILAIESRYDVSLTWYIMTSPINDDDTRAFFTDNNHFGLDPQQVVFFQQGVLPSIDADGRMLLAQKDHVAVNPDGHGGSLLALAVSGSLEHMRARGIEQISYFQVDNPLVHVLDPLFIGLHVAAKDSSGQISSKMIPKRDPGEKVGVLCMVDGKTRVIEYSDIDPGIAAETDENGRLRLRAGSIGIHMMSVEFVEHLTRNPDDFALPFHMAHKKVPYIDLDSGELVQPEQPNATKFEAFVFDAIPLADSSIVYETVRVEEFAPIKNASGEDSPESSHQLQSDRAGLWLEAAGCTVQRDGDGHVTSRIEIKASTAIEAGDLRDVELPESISDGEEVLL